MRRLNREEGLAMVTAVLVSMVVLFFAIAVVQLSLHNTNASARDRKRVQAVSAAEAGLDAAMGTVQAAVIDGSKGTYTLPCTASATLPMATTSTRLPTRTRARRRSRSPAR